MIDHPNRLPYISIYTLGMLLLLIFMANCAQGGPTNTPTSANPLSDLADTPLPVLSPSQESTKAPSQSPSTTPTQYPSSTPLPTSTPTEEGPRAERIPILEYHHPEYASHGAEISMTIDWFLEQMGWLHQNDFTTLSAEELIAFVDGLDRPPEKSVVLTFDIGTAHADGFRQVIIPTLRKYGYKALFFVLVNAITDDGAGNTLTWTDLREWQQEGLISIQSHGVYHPDYKDLTYDQMLWDSKTSYEIITEEMGELPLIFAYPYDSVPDNAERLMRDVGYQLALAGYRRERSVLFEDPDRFALPRYYPYSNEESYPILSDGYGWTFPELMLAAVGGPGQPLAASPSTLPEQEPYIPSNLNDLVNFCSAKGKEYLYAIDAAAQFPTDILPAAQALLQHPVIIRPTCNFGPPIIPDSIVLHFTQGPYSSTVNEFRENEYETSAHYIIDRDGTITQMVPEFFAAYHVTCYGYRSLCTPSCPICDDEQGKFTEPWTRSIGIELVNNGRLRGKYGDFRNPDDSPFTGLVYEDYLASFSYRYWEDYPIEQIEALRVLVEDIMNRWDIPLERVIGHSRIQPEKIDPGPALNLTWSRYGDPPREPIFQPTASP
jgi:N-acetyl-anhydromuramyl-L-alanine amidase AmpD/peptidoglycan/xylan/chitin deacetylase (PgdA/CDA1 family)